MPRNEQALKWEERCIQQQREDGWSWRRIVQYFILLNNFTGVNIALRLKNEEKFES